MSATEQSEVGTRERILDAAERLFGERGFEVVSLRDITGLAGANVASVNYHFGSKEKLIDAVVERHSVPMNERRMAMLGAAEGRHAGGMVPVREVLEAFLQPMIGHILEGADVGGFVLQVHGSDDVGAGVLPAEVGGADVPGHGVAVHGGVPPGRSRD